MGFVFNRAVLPPSGDAAGVGVGQFLPIQIEAQGLLDWGFKQFRTVDGLPGASGILTFGIEGGAAAGEKFIDAVRRLGLEPRQVVLDPHVVEERGDALVLDPEPQQLVPGRRRVDDQRDAKR